MSRAGQGDRTERGDRTGRDERADRTARIREAMREEGDAIAEHTREHNAGRKAVTEDFPEYETLRERARAVKEDAIENLPDLVDRLRESVEANGGHLYVADDAADANRYIVETVGDAETVVKSKSMTTEEIDLNDALEAAGVEPVETDLGEWVIQLAEESPSHLIGPAMHKDRAEIAALFAEVFDPADPPETATELTAFAREMLGKRIREADVGLTGANFVVAESGSLALVTNEGNARKVASTPDTHIAVSGVEKIVPTVEDLEPFLNLLSRAGAGQELSAYTSLLTPPVASPVPDFDAPDEPLSAPDDEGTTANPDREFHLVLIDNGRLAMREDEDLRETLYCVRCGACANSCGNFQSVGGHVFGGETYTGGIAGGWEAGIEGLNVAGEFNDLCTGCSRCVPACPVKIDIPWINTVVRDRINRRKADASDFAFLPDGLAPDAEPAGLDLGKRFVGDFATLAKWGHRTAPLANRLADAGPVRAALERVVGIDRRRDLPTFASESLVEWFDRRGGARIPLADADRDAILYPDTYTNYVDVERGKAAVRALEALGVHVRVPSLPPSGRPPLSQGMVATAEERAHDLYAALAEHVDADRDVVVVEPSDLAMIRSEYERFLEPAAFERLAGASYEVLEYVYGLLENGASIDALVGGDDATRTSELAYHPHCQARTLDLEVYTLTVLERAGYDVRTSDTECCGMAGSFGYKTEYYELSIDVGEPLVEDFGGTDRTLVASGTSCGEQLDALLDRPARHPIELLAPPDSASR
ncbi:iron-sulfur cluster-binding protein [Halopenitus malekzadehii]|uniref:Iron-sulfur cluster-binding protein n=1 Tax=Halopenitus malekzadehii TaxID=1267564 RepID=A0A1H6IZ39_9EURY|nr:iron-sulfur cluster-binding protein [Halopenitus malekzadehii]